MTVELIQVPYDAGHRGRRMGCGPGHFIAHGAADRLRSTGHTVTVSAVETSDAHPAEIATTFELARRLAGRVRAACRAGRFPLILSGNCSCCLGVVAGLDRSEDAAVLWLDAHADFNTPETTTSGYGTAGSRPPSALRWPRWDAREGDCTCTSTWTCSTPPRRVPTTWPHRAGSPFARCATPSRSRRAPARSRRLP